MLRYRFETNFVPVEAYDGNPAFKVEAKIRCENIEDKIKYVLPYYWRWIAEGKKKKGYSAGEQSYYDPYENYIEYIPAENVHLYSFQTDSGIVDDSWVRGEFRILHCGEIEIL